MGLADSPLHGRVIFVEGAPRSGTTALASMLAVHAQIAGVVAESHLFSHGVNALFENHAQHGLHQLSSYVTDDELTDLVRELCDGVLMRMRARVKPGAPFVMEKTPAPMRVGGVHAYKRRVYPDAIYLHIVRDREAVVESLRRASWSRVDRAGAGRAREQALGAIRSSFGDLPGYSELDHAHLLADPVACLGPVLERAGIGLDENSAAAIRGVAAERISSHAPAPAPTRPVPGRPARASASVRRLAARLLPQAGAAAGRRAQAMIEAIREHDQRRIGELLSADAVVELRSGAGDLRAEGPEAAAALASMAARIFARSPIAEDWARSSLRPVVVFRFGAIYGDGTRADAVFSFAIERGQITRVDVVVAGPPGGRPSRRWDPGADGRR